MNKMVLAAATAALITIPATSMAQSAEAKPFLVRVGAFFPTDEDAKDVSKTWLAAGVQYKVRDLNIGNTNGYMSSFEISFDYTQRDDYQILPLMLNYVGRVNENLFYTGGIGVSFTRLPTASGTDSKARFGYTLGLGYDLNIGTTPVVVEGRFWGNEKSDFNGFALYAGVRF